MKVSKLILILPITLVFVSFQNCSKSGFTSQFSILQSSEVQDSNNDQNSVVVDPWLKGEAAWNLSRNGLSCNTCHGSLESTNKRGASTSQIRLAFQNVVQMKSLILQEEELNQISYALNNLKPGTIPGTNTVLKYTCTDESMRGTGHKDSRRLSEVELKNTLADLFGTTIYNNSEVAAQIALLPKDSHERSDLFLPTVNAGIIDSMVEVAYTIGQVASANTNFVNRFSGCTQLSSATCVRNFVTRFGARALRKPLPTTDIDRLVNAYNSDPTTTDGTTLIASILLRVDFINHYEVGNLSGNRIRLTSYEVASRLSYMLTSSLPDDTLWTAAANNQLSDLSQLRPHVERLIDSARGKQKVYAFFREWMGVRPTAEVSVSNAYRNGINVNNLYSSAVEDFNRFVEYIIWTRNGNLTSLFSDTTVFPNSSELASVYGTSVWSSGSGLTSNNGHKGIFLRAASLIKGNNNTPIILRGVKVRRELLCQPLPAPSQEVINMRDGSLSEEEISHVLNPNRIVVKNMTKSALCMSCHTKINPLGFALENFDSLGRKQTIERVFDSNDQLIASHGIDTASDAPVIEPGGKTRVLDAGDLNSQILESNSLKSCMAEKLTRNLYMRNVASQDNCALSDKEILLQTPNSNLRELLIKNAANADLFWKGKE